MGLPHQEETAIGIDVLLINGENFNRVLDALVRERPPHEKEIRLVVVEHLEDDRIPRSFQLVAIEHQRKHPGGMKTHRLELRAIEFRITDRQSNPLVEGGELAPSVIAKTHKVRMELGEPTRGRNVVVNQHERIGKVIRIRRDSGTDREVKNEDVVGARDLSVVPELVCQSRHLGVDRLREDLGIVAAAPEYGLDAERLVPDGVAIAQCRQHLMNLHL